MLDQFYSLLRSDIIVESPKGFISYNHHNSVEQFIHALGVANRICTNNINLIFSDSENVRQLKSFINSFILYKGAYGFKGYGSSQSRVYRESSGSPRVELVLTEDIVRMIAAYTDVHLSTLKSLLKLGQDFISESKKKENAPVAKNTRKTTASKPIILKPGFTSKEFYFIMQRVLNQVAQFDNINKAAAGRNLSQSFTLSDGTELNATDFGNSLSTPIEKQNEKSLIKAHRLFKSISDEIWAEMPKNRK